MLLFIIQFASSSMQQKQKQNNQKPLHSKQTKYNIQYKTKKFKPNNEYYNILHTSLFCLLRVKVIITLKGSTGSCFVST